MRLTRCFPFACCSDHLLSLYVFTVVSETKGTFIFEIVMERFIYLRNTQKQLKITNYRLFDSVNTGGAANF